MFSHRRPWSFFDAIRAENAMIALNPEQMKLPENGAVRMDQATHNQIASLVWGMT
jgi:hypothetical protein